MTKRARVWAGFTVILVLVINYTMVGMPLFKKEMAISAKYNEIVSKNVTSGDSIESFTDNYLLDVLKREKVSLDNKLKILNAVTASLAVIVASWMIYGIIVKDK